MSSSLPQPHHHHHQVTTTTTGRLWMGCWGKCWRVLLLLLLYIYNTNDDDDDTGDYTRNHHHACQQQPPKVCWPKKESVGRSNRFRFLGGYSGRRGDGSRMELQSSSSSSSKQRWWVVIVGVVSVERANELVVVDRSRKRQKKQNKAR